MKQLTFILGLMALISCKDSGDFDLSYPLFEVADVSINSTTSITAEVAFTHIGSDEIVRHGFVWDWIRSPSLGTFGTISTGRGFIFIEEAPDFNGFSETIETDFQRSQTHTIRAFVITQSDTIYSTAKQFLPNP